MARPSVGTRRFLEDRLPSPEPATVRGADFSPQECAEGTVLRTQVRAPLGPNSMRRGFRSQPKPRAASAFTLIELLVVIAIIGLLAALLLPDPGRVRHGRQVGPLPEQSASGRDCPGALRGRRAGLPARDCLGIPRRHATGPQTPQFPGRVSLSREGAPGEPGPGPVRGRPAQTERALWLQLARWGEHPAERTRLAADERSQPRPWRQLGDRRGRGASVPSPRKRGAGAEPDDRRGRRARGLGAALGRGQHALRRLGLQHLPARPEDPIRPSPGQKCTTPA